MSPTHVSLGLSSSDHIRSTHPTFTAVHAPHSSRSDLACRCCCCIVLVGGLGGEGRCCSSGLDLRRAGATIHLGLQAACHRPLRGMLQCTFTQHTFTRSSKRVRAREALDSRARACCVLPLDFLNKTGLCEKDPALAHALNVSGTAHIVAAVSELEGLDPSLRTHMVHFSTDWVYDSSGSLKAVSDVQRGSGVYGATKLAAEEALTSESSAWARDHRRYTILRSSIIYGPPSPITGKHSFLKVGQRPRADAARGVKHLSWRLGADPARFLCLLMFVFSSCSTACAVKLVWMRFRTSIVRPCPSRLFWQLCCSSRVPPARRATQS